MKPLTEHLTEELKKRNIKPTQQRLMVLEYLANNPHHPTVDQIYKNLQKLIPTLSKATIYNTIDSFMEAGLLRMITIEENETRYDITTGDHGHFKCGACGKIYDFTVGTENMQIQELDGFSVTDKNVYFKGTCKGCLSIKKTYKKGEKKMSDNKTMHNLMEAFAGESQANRKYLAYAKKAEKEGKINAAKLFRAAAEAETLHALKHLEVAGKIGSTAENLKDGIEGETHEFTGMYPEFLKDAREDGNRAAIITFEYAMKAEEVHAKLYREALENINKTEEIFYYLCPVCGNIEKSVPDKCFICNVPGSSFIKY